jgi:hypothetical protein
VILCVFSNDLAEFLCFRGSSLQAAWMPQFVIRTCERIWLRHYATNRKVAGSIPDEVIGLFLIYLNLPAVL